MSENETMSENELKRINTERYERNQIARKKERKKEKEKQLRRQSQKKGNIQYILLFRFNIF